MTTDFWLGCALEIIVNGFIACPGYTHKALKTLPRSSNRHQSQDLKRTSLYIYISFQRKTHPQSTGLPPLSKVGVEERKKRFHLMLPAALPVCTEGKGNTCSSTRKHHSWVSSRQQDAAIRKGQRERACCKQSEEWALGRTASATTKPHAHKRSFFQKT